jgi:Double-GTPase 2
MDDLIVGLLAAFVFIVVAFFAIVAAICVLAATAAGTSLWALVEGLRSFTATFVKSIGERGGARRQVRDPEPAFELYVLGQLFADFRFALQQAAEALAEVRKRLSAFADKWSEGATLPLSIGAVVGGYLGTAVAGLGGVLVGACVGLVVGVATAGSWTMIWILRLADAARRRIRHAAYECPVDHERFPLPVYVCPACSAEHKRLVPGRWGIFKRECRCGKTALPTTVIRGRQKVPQRCPSGHPMSGILGFVENLPVAIVGGPSSGKSAFLAGALIEIEDPATGLSLEPLSESRDAYARLLDAMRSGNPPEKTTNEHPPALVAELQAAGRARALYAYDVAGEVYGAEDKMRGLRFLASSTGVAILIDPFAIPRVADDRAEQLASIASRVLPSNEDPMHVLERLISTLMEAGIDPASIPLAVVVAKTDACGIDKEIERIAESVGAETAPRAWLEKNGAGNLVRAIDQQFKQVGWFASSALGRMPDPGNSRAFVPRGALAPLLWILERRNVRVAKSPVVKPSVAKTLVGGETDFPPPSGRGRVLRAVVAAALATVALAVPVALAAGQFGGGATGNSASGESGSSASATSTAPPATTAVPKPKSHRPAPPSRSLPRPKGAPEHRAAKPSTRGTRHPGGTHNAPSGSSPSSGSTHVASNPGGSGSGGSATRGASSSGSSSGAGRAGSGGGLQGSAQSESSSSSPPSGSASGSEGLSGSAGGSGGAGSGGRGGGGGLSGSSGG